jgi:hypothetical protein
MMINTRNTLGTSGFDSLRAAVMCAVMVIAAIALLATTGAAQQGRIADAARFEVFGVVVDAQTGESLVGAWVGITGTDWGSLTNDEGRFRIPDVSAGPLELTVEQLGYETLAWDGTVQSADDLIRIELGAQPIVLEGLQVVTDRFRSRRRAAATSVRAFERGDLATSGARDALDFIETHSAARLTSCNGRRGNQCLFVRGRNVEPVVYVDEIPLIGGLSYLQAYQPWEFQMIEVYAGGRHIRAYTPRYMERAAKQRLSPLPLPF